jgi:hypothetical protein
MVVWKVDADPPQIFMYDDEREARELFERARQNWTEVYLCWVTQGPGPVEEYPCSN